ncbi:MAG: GNAT family N-acetyltransferase [Maribacter sp.]|nr:GNAT family N-acetyltransferase [Maribacter sp.]MBT8313695.1 GNAT family N-acetyltransferase [Maribacter sp.]NNK19584.1 GNAT family N-acetyltransferase [Maribacter sp.]
MTKLEINITQLPSEKELKKLFSQTTWASKRKNQDIRKMLENLNVFVTIRKNSALIGFGRAITDGIYRALIDDIIVDNSYQKRGLGKVIVENLLKQLVGIDEIFLNTKPDLEEFYKKFGFAKVRTITMKK